MTGAAEAVEIAIGPPLPAGREQRRYLTEEESPGEKVFAPRAESTVAASR
jgi:hypothetical protein